MTRTARALRSTLVVSAFGYSAQALSLIAIPLFLTKLGADGYGLMVTVMAFMGYLGFADAGLSWGSMILIAHAHGRGSKAEIAHIVRHSVVLAVASGLVVALAVVGIFLASRFGWPLPMFAGHPEADRLVLIGGVQLGLTFQFSIFYNLFHGLQEGYWPGVYQGVGRILGLACAMLAAWQTSSVEAVMLVLLVFTALSGVAAGFHAWLRHPWAFTSGSWTDRAQYRAQLRIGVKNFLLQIGRTLSGTAPTLGISSILGPGAVPFYTVPSTLLTLFFTPINSWSANMQGAYGEASAAGAKEWSRATFRQSLERALLFGGLGIALFLGLGDSFVRLWTHNRLWIDPAMAVSISAIVGIGAFLVAGQFLLTGLNRHRDVALAEIANGLLAILLVIGAVRWFGLGAVGVAIVGAALPTSVWVLRRDVSAQLGLNCFPTWPFVFKVFVAGIAGFVASVTAARAGVSSDQGVLVPQLTLGVFAGVAAFPAAALALNLLATAEVAILGRRLRQRFFAPAS